MVEIIKYKGFQIYIKESNGKHQHPFSWYVKNNYGETVAEGVEAFLQKDKCISDSRKHIDLKEQEYQSKLTKKDCG